MWKPKVSHQMSQILSNKTMLFKTGNKISIFSSQYSSQAHNEIINIVRPPKEVEGMRHKNEK